MHEVIGIETLNHALFILSILTWLPKSSRTNILIDSQSGLTTLSYLIYDKAEWLYLITTETFSKTVIPTEFFSPH